MTKQKAIRKYCFDCCSGSVKDIVFCTDPKCSLWPWRLGVGPRSKEWREIMEANMRKYPKDFEELSSYGVDASIYFPKNPSQHAKDVAKTHFSAVKVSGAGEN